MKRSESDALGPVGLDMRRRENGRYESTPLPTDQRQGDLLREVCCASRSAVPALLHQVHLKGVKPLPTDPRLGGPCMRSAAPALLRQVHLKAVKPLPTDPRWGSCLLC